MNGYPHHKLEERGRQFARVVHELYVALQHLRHAHTINHIHALGLDLPSEKTIASAIDECARAQKGNPQ